MQQYIVETGINLDEQETTATARYLFGAEVRGRKRLFARFLSWRAAAKRLSLPSTETGDPCGEKQR